MSCNRNLLAVLLVSFLVISCSTESEKTDIEEESRLGREALSSNRYSESIGHFEKAVLVSPANTELHYWLGVAYWNREQGEQAVAAYLRAIESDPDGTSEWSLYAVENLAEVYTRTDQSVLSREMYRKALERETRPEWIRKIENQIAELDLALDEFTSDDRTVFNDRGEVIGGVGPGAMRTNRNFEIARHTNDPAKEAKYYRLAIETDPTMYQSYFNLGLALVRLGRFEEAVPWLMRSDSVWKADTESNPDRIDKTDAHAFLTLCYLEFGDLDSARRHSEIARATGQPDYWANLYSARAQIESGQAEMATTLLNTMLADNPEHVETLYALSLAHSALGNDTEGREALQKAIALIPDNHPWMGRLREKWELELE